MTGSRSKKREVGLWIREAQGKMVTRRHGSCNAHNRSRCKVHNVKCDYSKTENEGCECPSPQISAPIPATNLIHLATAAAVTMAGESVTSGSMDSLSRVRLHKPKFPVDLAARAVPSNSDLHTVCGVQKHTLVHPDRCVIVAA